jgi:hypothetical protein
LLYYGFHKGKNGYYLLPVFICLQELIPSFFRNCISCRFSGTKKSDGVIFGGILGVLSTLLSTGSILEKWSIILLLPKTAL